jgi:methylglutaconyl-CoA hydratase
VERTGAAGQVRRLPDVTEITMPFDCISVRREGAVEHVVLNRPAVRNAFNEHTIRELTWWAESAARDRDLRVGILSGIGPVFCAGADVKWMSRMIGFTQQENIEDATEMGRMFLALDRLPIPLIGRVQGAALGGGAGLCAVCDVVVAAEDAVFGFTEVKLGIIPAVISPFVLVKIGRSAARELFLTGARFSAKRAQAIGLAHAVVPAGELDATVDAYVKELLTSAPEALAAAKALIPEVARRGPGEATALTAEAIARRRVASEGQEGLRAFLEKRTPSWILKD